MVRRASFVVIAIFIAVIQFFSSVPLPVFAFAGGSGTSGDPYQITTPAELASLNSYIGSSHSSKYYKIMNDIDLDVSPYNTGNGWTPIANSSNQFQGKLNGNFKTVSNLYINNASAGLAGLFAYIGLNGIVENLILTDVDINASGSHVAAIAAQNNGTITKSAVIGGTVKGKMRVGALAGSNARMVSKSYSTGVTVTQLAATSDCCVGGLLGETAFDTTNAKIEDSYSRNNVIHTSSGQGAFGGLMGNDYNSAAKARNYSTGSISTLSSYPSSVGGLQGTNYTNNTTSSYWDTETSGRATSGGGAGVVGKTTAQMKTQETFVGWDFDTVWAISPSFNDGYPYLQWQSTNTAPTVSTLGPAGFVGGGYTNETQPELTFTTADTNDGDTVKFQIQIDNNSDFSSPVVDYTSALASPGASSFTVGQVAGSGTYTTGSAGQELTDASYYWRVRAIDNSDSASSYSAANSGAVAYILDTAAPTTPGTPSTASPTADTTPTWSWTASTDTVGLHPTEPYTIQWSSSSNFSAITGSASSNTNSYTHGTALTEGTWYVRVSAKDGNNQSSSYSATGQVIVDTSAPDAVSINSSSHTANAWSNSLTAVFTWTAPTDPTLLGYSSVFDTSASADPTESANLGLVTTATHEISEDGSYYFHIKPTDSLGNWGTVSRYGPLKIDTVLPTAPTNLEVLSADTVNKPTLSWTASTDAASGVASYILQWSKDSSFSTGVSSQTTTSTQLSLTTALESGQWYFRVIAVDNAGNSSVASASKAHTIVSSSVTSTPTSSPQVAQVGEALNGAVQKLNDSFSTQPKVFTNKWRFFNNLRLAKVVNASLPHSIAFYLKSFPALDLAFKELSIASVADLSRLDKVNLDIPSISELSPDNLPAEVIFPKASNGEIAFNTKLTISSQGDAVQVLNAISGNELELVTKPVSEVNSITGQLVLTKGGFSYRDREKISVPAFLISTASAASENEIEERLLVDEFLYSPLGDGTYKASIKLPVVDGEYEIITRYNYKSEQLGSKEVRLVTIIDPEGYVYEKIRKQEARINDAKVTLEVRAQSGNFIPWPAQNFAQTNPQTTDETGKYAFLAPEGSYRIKVEASGYKTYISEAFDLTADGGVHKNIQLKRSGLAGVNWTMTIQIAILLMLIYLVIRKRRS